MSDFDLSGAVPTVISRVTMNLKSELHQELDTDGVPTGVVTEHKDVILRVMTSDDNLSAIREYTAINNDIVDIGLITQEQKDQIIAILDTIKSNAATKLLS